MEYEIQNEREKLKEGFYKGVIEEILYRNSVNKKGQNFKVATLKIKVDNFNDFVFVSYSAFVSPNSLFGQLLVRFGADLKQGMKVNDNILLGRSCQFMVVEEGQYNNILREKLKPLPSF